MEMYVNRPTIEFAYIRGHKGNSNKPNQRYESIEFEQYCNQFNKTSQDVYNMDTGNEYQGRGLALDMYKIAADWMALNSLPMCKGGTNEYSFPLWGKQMPKDDRFNLIKESDNKYKLDHRKFDLSYFNIKAKNAKKTPLKKPN
jgi:hypothetical protein